MKKIILLTSIFFGSFTTLNAAPYCKNMTSCEEACKYLQQGYTRLDRDRDGIPCENVCDKPCKKKVKKSSKKKK